jgi:hypothetical protein
VSRVQIFLCYIPSRSVVGVHFVQIRLVGRFAEIRSELQVRFLVATGFNLYTLNRFHFSHCETFKTRRAFLREQLKQL